MIEVEKKFILSDEEKSRLLEGADFIGEKVFTDIYYDTKDFTLTSADKWLRARENKFEFKVAMHAGAKKSLTQYDEIEDESRIGQVLGLSANKKLPEQLLENGYLPFCVCKTTRRKYKKENFTIDIDVADFGSFLYNIAEIELMVNDNSEMDEAAEKITNFAKSQELRVGPARGKIVEFLKRERPNHFEALIKSGVVHNG